jgi:hypothetical protein
MRPSNEGRPVSSVARLGSECSGSVGGGATVTAISES